MSVRVYYRESTGRPLWLEDANLGSVHDSPVDHNQEGIAFIVVKGAASQDLAEKLSGLYMKDGALASRPEMPLEVKQHIVTAPEGTEFSVQGPVKSAGTVDATKTLEFEFDEPGEYTVKLSKFPYLDAEVVLHAS